MTAYLETDAPADLVQPSHLCAYAPPTLVRELANAARDGVPDGARFDAAVLFADVSGFTALASRMAERGAGGTEELTQHLNACFGTMLRLVDGAGGDVEKFAGDALLAVFRVQDGEVDGGPAVQRAASCALAVAEEISKRSSRDVALGVHAGIGFGALRTRHVATGVITRAFILSGDALEQAAAANNEAKDGEVCLSRGASRAASFGIETIERTGGHARVVSVRGSVPDSTRPVYVRADEDPARLERYLNRALVERMVLARDASWIAELRRTTVVFVSIAAEDGDAVADDQLAKIGRLLGDHVARLDGLLFDFLADDKGLVAILLFGVRNAHEDDAARAIQGALDLEAALRDANVQPHIGVATGRVYCGVIGSETRKELAVVGDAMNLAARLMGAAKTGVLAAPTTMTDAADRFDFTPVTNLALKNVTPDFVAYRPTPKAARRTLRAREGASIVGREAEWGTISAVLAAHRAQPSFAALTLLGEAGIGKSALVRRFDEEVRLPHGPSSATVLHVTGDAIDQVSPYHAWRDPAASLLGLDLTASASSQREAITRRMSTLPGVAALSPLLSVLVPHAPPETARTRGLEPQTRAEQTRDVLLALLSAAADEGPLAVIVEDAHWFDSASWSLVQQIALRKLPVLLLVTTRPPSEEWASSLDAFREQSRVQTINLGPLSPEASAKLVCSKLDVESLSTGVESLIFGRAAGHPFFTEELTLALRDAGLLRIEQGACMLASSDRDRAALALPDTLERVITSRIDRLREPERLALKVASVLGRDFSLSTLRAVFPSDPSTVASHVTTLCDLELLIERGAGELRFKHAITQEVGYSLLPFAQRRELHRGVAEHIEAGGDLASEAAHLAHHWGLAGAPTKAWPHAEEAAARALSRFANREAVHFFREALRFQDAAGDKAEPVRVARWESDLGLAHRALGELDESRRHCEAALTRLGHPIPAKTARARLGLGVQMARMFAARPKVSPNQTPDPAANTALNAYTQLSTLSHYDNDIEVMMFSTAHAAAVAGRAGATIEVATLYGSVAHVAAFAKVFASSRAYAKGAHAVADVVRTAHCTGTVNQYTGHLAGCMGDLATFDQDMHRAQAAFAELGPGRPSEEVLTNLGYLYQFRGDLPRALHTMQTLERSGRARDDAQTTGWGIVGQGRVLSAQGDLEAARRRFDAAEATVTDSLTLSELFGNRALVQLRLGELPRALEDAARALVVAEQNPSTSYTTLPGYCAVMEVFALACLGSEGSRLVSSGKISRITVRELAARMYEAFAKYAKLFLIAEPQRAIWGGVMLAISGQPMKAAAAWEKAALRAAKSAVVDDAASSLRWLARAHTGDQRRATLRRASELFGATGRAFEAKEAREYVAGSRSSKSIAPWEGPS